MVEQRAAAECLLWVLRRRWPVYCTGQWPREAMQRHYKQFRWGTVQTYRNVEDAELQARRFPGIWQEPPPRWQMVFDSTPKSLTGRIA
jgi:hypothetical protein